MRRSRSRPANEPAGATAPAGLARHLQRCLPGDRGAPARIAGASPIGLQTRRGARIRTGDLSDPNGARYQAAPHPERSKGSDNRPLAHRDEIIRHANELLEIDRFPEYGTPGLQVVGADDVSKIACGVSSSRELFERAAAAGAQLVIVHHGMFWRNEPRLDRPAPARPARGAVRGGPQPRRLPPRARRASRARQQRAARRRARRRGRAPFGDVGQGGTLPRAARDRRARGPDHETSSAGASRSSSPTARSRSSASRSARAAPAAS